MKTENAAFIAEVVEPGPATAHTPDTLLGTVMQRLHDRQPGWDRVGIDLLVGDTLALGRTSAT